MRGKILVHKNQGDEISVDRNQGGISVHRNPRGRAKFECTELRGGDKMSMRPPMGRV